MPASPPKRKKRRSSRWLLWLSGAGLLALFAYGFWPGPIAVESAAARRGPLKVTVYEEGKTRIRHRYTITAPIAGTLRRVPLRAGAAIEAGKTVLATLDRELAGFLNPRMLAEAHARLQAAEAASRLRRAEEDRAKAQLDLAQKELERTRRLFESRAISGRELDAAVSLVEVRTRENDAAGFARSVAEFEIRQAQAALLQNEPSQEAAQALEIVAPVSGTVLKVFEESERRVAPGAAIMEVGDPRDLEAEIELLSSDAVRVAPGAEVSIEQWGGEPPLRGRVALVERGGFTKVSALGVEEQRVLVRVDFLDSPPPGHDLGDRFRVEARIVTWQGADVLQIPTGALFRRGNDWYVFVIEGGRARSRKVGIDHQNGLAAEVTDGLKEGERVILYPPDAVTEGVAVGSE